MPVEWKGLGFQRMVCGVILNLRGVWGGHRYISDSPHPIYHARGVGIFPPAPPSCMWWISRHAICVKEVPFSLINYFERVGFGEGRQGRKSCWGWMESWENGPFEYELKWETSKRKKYGRPLTVYTTAKRFHSRAARSLSSSSAGDAAAQAFWTMLNEEQVFGGVSLGKEVISLTEDSLYNETTDNRSLKLCTEFLWCTQCLA